MFQISEDEFYDEYKPQINHFERARQPLSVADEDVSSFGGCMYETYGEEVEYVLSLVGSGRVVTIIDNDGDLYISSGYRLVNRLGYMILDKPYTTDFVVKLD